MVSPALLHFPLVSLAAVAGEDLQVQTGHFMLKRKHKLTTGPCLNAAKEKKKNPA